MILLSRGSIVRVLLALLVLLILSAGTYVWTARYVVSGYAAKYLCSGLYISGLPERWLKDVAIAPAVEPLSSWIKYQIDDDARRVSASVFGYEQRARWRGTSGCVLQPEGARVESFSSSLDRTVLDKQQPWPQGDAEPVQWLAAEQMQQVQALLDRAFAEPDHERRQTVAIAIAHRGQLLAERYQSPVTRKTPLLGWSMTKSLLASWVGIQQQAGELDMQQSVSTFWPDMDKRLVLEHLLRMESGLDFDESYQPGDDVTRMLYQQEDMAAYAAASSQKHAPGEHWYYSSGNSNIAAHVWLQSLRKPFDDWLRQRFMQPLHIDQAWVETDGKGLPVASSYGYMNARNWLKVGQLWLDAWHGRSALLSQSWMQQAVTPSAINRKQHYGVSFWLNGLKGNQGEHYWPTLPTNIFWARGHDGQYVLVLPEHELVITRFGFTPWGNDDGMEALAAGLIQLLSQ